MHGRLEAVQEKQLTLGIFCQTETLKVVYEIQILSLACRQEVIERYCKEKGIVVVAAWVAVFC